jgi:hypothetical protein
MGYDLKGSNGNEFRFNVFTFSPILLGAMQYGWKPMGVYPTEIDKEYLEIEDERVGEGDIRLYLSNDYRHVGYDDADNLKVALQKALDDDYSFDMRHEKDEKMKKGLSAFLGIEDKDTTIEFPTFTKKQFQEQAKKFIKFLDEADGFFIG